MTKAPIRYIGGKARVAKQLISHILPFEKELFIDVFGGSGAMTATAGASGFHKLIYNDIDEDLLNFFRVLRDDAQRKKLTRWLTDTPMSRAEYQRLTTIYQAGNRSFHRLAPVERAAAVFYRAAFAYAGKLSTGGFSCSSIDRTFIKERASYHGRLRLLGRFAAFWKKVTLECLPFDRLLQAYGSRTNAVIYCDPPYFGAEAYYSRGFARGNHVMLAEQINAITAPSAVSYYPFEGIKDLYPPERWNHLEIQTVKNSIGSGKKEEVQELLLVRKD